MELILLDANLLIYACPRRPLARAGDSASSTDGDFARFSGVHWVNPLVSA